MGNAMPTTGTSYTCPCTPAATREGSRDQVMRWGDTRGEEVTTRDEGMVCDEERARRSANEKEKKKWRTRWLQRPESHLGSGGRGNRRGGARTEAREPDKCDSEGARLEAHIYNKHRQAQKWNEVGERGQCTECTSSVRWDCARRCYKRAHRKPASTAGP